MNSATPDGELELRVSVATLDRVVFPHPSDGTIMLALERKATVLDAGKPVHVAAQPFGGAVRILNPNSLVHLVGSIRFDGPRSESEQDFRILIHPEEWEQVRQFCLARLAEPANADLETTPERELVEEFAEVLGTNLRLEQYTCQPIGLVVEENPAPTTNTYAGGQPTVRVYRIFEVQIVDAALCKTILDESHRFSDRDMQALAQKDKNGGGRGRANKVLVLPLETVWSAYLSLTMPQRYRTIEVEGHRLFVSVAAVLDGLEIPQYERIKR